MASKRNKQRMVEIAEERFPTNTESVYVVRICRPGMRPWDYRYHVSEARAKKIMDIVGHGNFFIELDGGVIRLIAYLDNNWTVSERSEPCHTGIETIYAVTSASGNAGGVTISFPAGGASGAGQ